MRGKVIKVIGQCVRGCLQISKIFTVIFYGPDMEKLKFMVPLPSALFIYETP